MQPPGGKSTKETKKTAIPSKGHEFNGHSLNGRFLDLQGLAFIKISFDAPCR